jgi:ABC-type transport system involved in cytochrome c biogenesis permease subunit
VTLFQILALAVATNVWGQAAPPVPDAFDLSTIRTIAVQHDGRWPPLDTVARDLVQSITGTETYHGHDPVAVLLAWTFEPSAWRDAPLITIGNAELRRELKLPANKTQFSFTELTSQRHLHALVDDLSSIPEGQKLNPLEAEVKEIHEMLLTLRSIFSGRVLNLLPDPDNPFGVWRPIPRFGLTDGRMSTAACKAWAALGDAFVARNEERFATASQELVTELQSLPAEFRPGNELVKTELWYMRLRPFRAAWIVMGMATLLCAGRFWIHRRWYDALSVLGVIAGFGILSYGIWLRWQIAGRIPASNMFESMLFLGWGTGLLGVVAMITVRHRIAVLTAAAMCTIALMLAEVLPMDKFIRPIPPVLADTAWMAIHVPIIMLSYALLALGVLIAHVQLVTMALFPGRRHWVTKIDEWHYWYIHIGSLVLLAGIATGSMWAASSWGRYWGWDPKEVWSLVALLAYLAILHVRINREQTPVWALAVGLSLVAAAIVLIIFNLDPQTIGGVALLAGAVGGAAVLLLGHGPLTTALKSVLAFWFIIMTYVGVNYVLGTGLHSYGFGTGAVARYMYLIGGIDLALVASCVTVYLARRREGHPQPQPSTSPMAAS